MNLTSVVTPRAAPGTDSLSRVLGVRDGSEFRAPSRDLPRSLLWGTLLVTVTYLLMNIAYYSVLSPARVAPGGSTAAVAMQTAWGERALLLVSAVVLTSTSEQPTE